MENGMSDEGRETGRDFLVACHYMDYLERGQNSWARCLPIHVNPLTRITRDCKNVIQDFEPPSNLSN